MQFLRESSQVRGGGANPSPATKPNPDPAPIDILLPADPHQLTHDKPHYMSSRTLILNTLADLCPHGMLPLSYGVASYNAGGPNGLITSAVTLCGFSSLGLYGLISIGRAAQERGRPGMGDSLSGVWDDVMASKNTKKERNAGR